MTEKKRPDPDDYLSRGLSSVIRRQRAREGGGLPPLGNEPPRHDDEDAGLPDELAGHPVVDRIGRGGVGLVYRVSDRKIGRELAVKVLSRRHASDPEMVRRFQAEARICGQLQHPGVVPIHDTGQLDDGRPFFTMKVVEGDTLIELLQARADPEANRRRFLEVFEKVCQTLAYVHAQGVVHGDVKPSNVMVGAFGEVQVMDWGFARSVHPEAGPWHGVQQQAPGDEPLGDTGSQHILGTPAYMAPEQARGDEAGITSRTDVFGLGAILCEILTGRPPYLGDTKSATYLQATQGWQEDARSALRACETDPALVDLALRCLAPDAADRPNDAAAVDDEIAGYLEGLEARARELELKAVAAEARAQHERRARRLLLAMGSTVLIAVVTIAGSLLWIQQERATRQTEANRLVAQATERARLLRDQARAQPPAELHGWDDALAAARQAAQLAAGQGAAAANRDRAETLARDVEREAKAARRVHELLEWLEEMRPHYTDDRSAAHLAQGYAAGFERFGFHLDDREATVAEIRASPIAGILCAALDDWARLARNLEDAAPGWRELVKVARRADPQPFRDRLRSAFLADDLDALRRLAGSGKLAGEAPETVNLMAKCLFDLGAEPEAIAVLRSAVIRHPTDYWILHDLAVFLRRQEDARADEILGLCRASVAIRPRDPHALADLAHTLAILHGHWSAAAEVLQQALAVDPDYARVWFGEVLVLAGEPELGLDRARAAARKWPENPVAHRVLGWTAHISGRLPEAAAAFAEAARLVPNDPAPRIELASVQFGSGALQAGHRTLADSKRLAEDGGLNELLIERADFFRAAELVGQRTALHATAGWPDPWRAWAKLIVGWPTEAAEEYSAWLDQDPLPAERQAHFLSAPRAAVLAAGALEPPARQRWEGKALQWLREHAAWCATQSASAGDSRVALTHLRWIQFDPVFAEQSWSESSRDDLARLREELERVAAELMGS